MKKNLRRQLIDDHFFSSKDRLNNSECECRNVDFLKFVNHKYRIYSNERPCTKERPSIENQGLHRPKTKNCITVCEK